MITEISEKDFKKLHLKGYKKSNGEVTEIDLNLLYEAEKSFTVSHNMERKIALFMTPDVTEDKIYKIKESVDSLYPDAMQETKERYIMNKVFDSCANYEKYYWNEVSTYNFWCGVKHIYIKKTKYEITADSENGSLHRKGIDKIYLIHVED